MEDPKTRIKIKIKFEKIVTWYKRFRFGKLPEQKSPAAEAPPSFAPWIDLPLDVTADILHRLGAAEMLETAEKVCKTWRSVCREPSMWRVVDVKNSGSCYDTRRLGSMCRRAVDRSGGDLMDINIEYFGNDELLHYISQRSSKLKRLRLSCCKNVSGKGVSSAAKRFRELEELHILFMNQMVVEDVEAIGVECLSLRSFTLIKHDAVSGVGNGNDYLVAIAKVMPNLVHLRLGFFGSTITNKGYQAILDGCPRVESLICW
ncbi:putative F-box/LRR-repeat protein 9 isoform X2 [Salvia miltiorrhiza]|uniref:putative F-box/LRR-repeat protein 9 isoform X2 n=1 Tax=Salvia miltiorrhiza TaxID=226208 RepID=UPI0025AC4E10|nr:putative F-box/LRR-repeat protein 9 isoform X2 [Salvia miltiorrhiza]XP_057797752.1 putative F-box/LRR-repeat protein 9 isoform X2 [Salvia miltiorrhiza]